MAAKDVSGDGGVMVTTKKRGNGVFPQPGQVVFAHYTGALATGQVFDSSVGKPHRVDGFYFQLGAGGVIKGWEVGFAAMTVGEEAVLTIAPEYGYGARGGSGIPGGATLVFDVVLLDAKDMTDSELAAQDAKVARLRG